MFRYKMILPAILFLISGITALGAKPMSIKASLDSATLEMGRQTRLHLNIIVPADKQGTLIAKPETKLTDNIEIVSLPAADTADLDNNLIEIKQDIIIQSFDSGDYVIPEIVYLSGTDSLLSNKLSLRVYPVNVSNMTTINPDADIEKGDSKWWDFLPDFLVDYWEWILTAIILIIICTVLYLAFRKKKINLPFKAQVPKLSPYEVAMRELSSLKEQNLCANGQEKEYYTRLTDILRVYLQERFSINAMEMTSTQITRALNENEETKMPNRLMRQILEIADFVKFAKVRPMPEDNVKSFNSALQFVEDTKPLPPSTEESDKSIPNK